MNDNTAVVCFMAVVLMPAMLHGVAKIVAAFKGQKIENSSED